MASKTTTAAMTMVAIGKRYPNCALAWYLLLLHRTHLAVDLLTCLLVSDGHASCFPDIMLNHLYTYTEPGEQ